MQNVLVIGATGDVGHGIVGALLAGGHRVVAAARNEKRLAALAAKFANPALSCLAGSVEDEAAAARLLAATQSQLPQLDGVVTSVNLPMGERRLLETSLDDLTAILRANVGMHFVAAKTFVPALHTGGLYLGIGGGMADMVFANMGHMAMCQAAQRNMFRALALDYAERDVVFRELLIRSMVAGESNRERAHPKWLTDAEIGRYVREILEKPAAFPDTILELKSKAQIAELG